MAKTDLPYDLAAVRRLLLDAFTAEDLRRFLHDRPTFRPVLTRLSAQEGLAGIVEQVINYCDTHLLFDQFLDAVREENPAQYARHESRLRASGTDEIALKLLKPGSILLGGRYRIVRHIARGGFGSVYLAEDTLLREQVAIKELIPALVGDEDALKRFLVEAKAMMQLSHPHIVRTREAFEAGNNYYMVMEYMPGGSLEGQFKARKAMPVDDAVRILAEVCEGLAYAHARGVVHCDLKPSNVLLAADGSAKVADFGVAHVSDQVVTRSWITPGGFAGGTLPYMSPEQTDGVRDNPRVDIYALGAILYRALTGRMYLDFDQRDTPRAQSDNVQRITSQEPVPPSSHNRRIPSWLEAVVLKALAKQPEDRYASAEEFRSALLSPPSEQAVPAVAPVVASAPHAAPVSRPAPAPGPTPAAVLRRLPAWVLPAAGGVALLAIVLVIAISMLGGGEPDATATIPAGPVALLTTAPTASPSVLVASPTPVPVVVTIAPTTAVPTATPTPTGVSPTATALLTEVSATLTPAPTKVPPTPTANVRSGRLAFTSNRDGNHEIYVIDLASSKLTRLTNDGALDYLPDWSPDGRTIAFTSHRLGNSDLWTVDSDGGEQKPVVTTEAWDDYARWAPDGKRLVLSTTGVTGGVANSEIFIRRSDGSLQQVTGSKEEDQSPDWSPDGRIIYGEGSKGQSNWDLLVINADGTGRTTLVGGPTVDIRGTWSPDGKWIAFSRVDADTNGNGALDEEDAGDVWVGQADGTGLRQLTSGLWTFGLAWSPDGRWIAFTLKRDSNGNGLADNDDQSEIWAAPAAGGDAVPLVQGSSQNGDPAWTK